MSNHNYTVAVLTASDSAYAGARADKSGPIIREMLEAAGCAVAETALLPDDREGLSAQIAQWCDKGGVDLVLTTGGTGFSPRDAMPEATLAIADRNAPGIAEGIRAHSMTLTNRAMLSRAVSVIRKQTLIVNLPGSPKAVRESLEFLLPVLGHALDVLRGNVSECAQPPAEGSIK